MFLNKNYQKNRFFIDLVAKPTNQISTCDHPLQSPSLVFLPLPS